MSDQPELRVTRLRDEEIPDLIRLKARVYGMPQSESEEFYRWKFFRNPHRGAQVPFWVLRDHERMLGGIGALPVRIMLFGREIPGEFACEMFIERGKQRSGFGTALMDAYIADSPLPLMMNTSEALHRFLLKRGFVDLSTRLHFWLRPLRPGPLLAVRWGGWRGTAARLAGPLLRGAFEARAALLRPRPDPAIDVEEVSEFGPWAEEVWRAAGADYPFIVIRDLPYLRWKYGQHPLWTYRVLRATRAGRTLGYLTFRLRTGSRDPLMQVQEIFARRVDSAARLALLARVVSEARNAGATAVKALATDATVRADLRRAGFIETRLSPGLLYPRQPGFDRPEIQDIASWYLTGGDSDIDYEA